ncbi:MAG: hypothetical protein ABSF52_02315 [Syntrophobacteraceae bacterium]
MKVRVLDDACARILAGAESILQKREGRNHEAYLALWDLLHKEDDKIAFMFNDLKRSTAFFKLAAWQSHGLVSESDLALFTEETHDAVKVINKYAL